MITTARTPPDSKTGAPAPRLGHRSATSPAAGTGAFACGDPTGDVYGKNRVHVPGEIGTPPAEIGLGTGASLKAGQKRAG